MTGSSMPYTCCSKVLPPAPCHLLHHLQIHCCSVLLPPGLAARSRNSNSEPAWLPDLLPAIMELCMAFLGCVLATVSPLLLLLLASKSNTVMALSSTKSGAPVMSNTTILAAVRELKSPHTVLQGSVTAWTAVIRFKRPPSSTMALNTCQTSADLPTAQSNPRWQLKADQVI